MKHLQHLYRSARIEVVGACSNARYCGNMATTTRAVAASGGHTPLCEDCAAEHDENLR